MAKKDLFAGRFKVIGVHEGGMAQVLICQDIHNGRFVAAKNPYKAPEYFSREARLWLGLGNHPNIVRAHTVHKVDGKPYLFMDFIGDRKGNPHTLRHDLNKEQISLEFVLRVGISVVRALKYAQSIFPGFVHRDLKPDNILINDKGDIFVSDFGIGRLPRYAAADAQPEKKTPAYDLISTCGTSLTGVGSFTGTIGYAAPEQYIDSSSASARADMFSLGVILYEALTGIGPFNPQDIQEEGLKVLQKVPSFNAEICRRVPIEVRNIVMKMLQFFPADRPESFDVIEKALAHSASRTSEKAGQQIADKNVPADTDASTLSNRIYSLIQLDELHLAKRAVLEFQRKHPWNYESPLLIRTIFKKTGEGKEGWQFVKDGARFDLVNPIKIIQRWPGKTGQGHKW